MVGYFVKKFISRLFFPVSLSLELIFIGLILLWFFPKQQRKGKILVSCGAVLMLLFSYSWFGDALLEPLEHHYPTQIEEKLEVAPANFIAVLGSGWYHDERLNGANNCCNEHFLARLCEMVRLHRLYPTARILVSVAGPDASSDKRVFMQKFCEIFKVDFSLMTIYTDALDTSDELLAFKMQVHQQPFFLVTSASHIPRAMLQSEQRGMMALAAPAGFYSVNNSNERWSPVKLFPGANGITRTERAFYEYLGLMWSRVSN